MSRTNRSPVCAVNSNVVNRDAQLGWNFATCKLVWQATQRTYHTGSNMKKLKSKQTAAAQTETVVG